MMPASMFELSRAMSLDEIRNQLPCAVSLLEWDSHHFGFLIGRVNSPDLSYGELDDTLRLARKGGIRLVYWFTSEDRVVPRSVMEGYDGTLVDQKATFTGRVSVLLQQDAYKHDTAIQICEYPCQTACADLLNLAVLAGRFSRFRLDPHIAHERFEELFHRWVDRSSLHEFADAVFVAQNTQRRILGLVTVSRCDEETGEIGLIAVAEEAQGCGLGRRLLQSAHSCMYNSQHNNSVVVTQLVNEPACRLYHSTGYTLERVENVYHFWL